MKLSIQNQQHRASGLNLLVTAIILWNTRYLERAVAALRGVEDVPDALLAHLSPLGWRRCDQNRLEDAGIRPLLLLTGC